MTDLPPIVKEQSSTFEAVLVRLAGWRVAVLFGFHAVVFAACYVAASLVRFDFALPASYTPSLQSSLPFVVLFQLVVSGLFGFYRGWWRYVGVTDVVRLTAGLTAGSLGLVALWYSTPALHLTALEGVSRAVLLVDWAFALLTLFGARLFVRIVKDKTRSEQRTGTRRVLIIGAGDAGEMLAREIQHRPQMGMKIVGFVDDQRAKWRSYIRGIEVRGPISRIAQISEETDADEALLAIPSASGRRIREIIHYLAECGLPCQTVPGIDQLVSGKVTTQLRPVNADDLLRREQIVIGDDRVRGLLRGGTIMVTGAGGSIGSELAAQILKYQPAELHLIEHSELALYQSLRRLQQPGTRVVPHLIDCADAAPILREVQPTLVIHAAAYKHVPLGEENPAEYVRNNCVTARRFAAECAAAGVERFVFISTDKAVNPTSVMGASKRAAEIALLDAGAATGMNVIVVRFGNVIGSSGSVVPLFLEQIAAGGPVTVTHPEATRYFIRTSEAISLILQAAAIEDAGKVYMLDMGEPIRISELARELIQLSNHTPDEIPIVYIGLRPGEKLQEEILSAPGAISPTEHPRVMMVAAEQPAPAAVREWFTRLEAATIARSEEVTSILRELVPEYAEEHARRVAAASAPAPVVRLHAVNLDH